MNKKGGYFKKILIGSIAAIFLLIGSVGYFLKWFSPSPPPLAAQRAEDISVENSKTYFTKPVNILVIGIDQRGNEISRSDTIMIYHLEPDSKTIRLLSVPRDTYVNIPGRGMDKVNHAYAFGNIVLTESTLEEFLGIKIDYHIEINFAGFVSLIDQLDGVTIDVEKDIKGTDIKKGRQKLDGQRALAYVRDRNDPMGDIARVGRQQKFMKAVALEIAGCQHKWILLTKVPRFYKSIKTDLSLEEAMAMYSAMENLELSTIQMEEVPGSFYNFAGISYWKPDINRTKLLVQQLFF